MSACLVQSRHSQVLTKSPAPNMLPHCSKRRLSCQNVMYDAIQGEAWAERPGRMRHRAGLVLKAGRHLDALHMSKLFHQINFAALLGLKDVELAQYDPKAGLVTHHAISPYHCRPFTCPSTKQPSPYLSAGVITALFDEVSTCAAMAADPSHRPGVSVTLEVQVLQHVGPGSEVVLRTWASKAGKTLAFLHMDLHDHNTGQLVAVGRHVKFLPLGWQWEALMTPALYPLTKHLVHKHAQDTVTQASKHTVTPEAAGPSLYSAFPVSERGSEAHFIVKPQHCNGFGKMHGGALAVLAEDVAMRHYCTVHGDKAPPKARHLSLSYYNAISRGDITLKPDTRTDLLPRGGKGGMAVVDVYAKRKKTSTTPDLCNQATVLWE